MRPLGSVLFLALLPVRVLAQAPSPAGSPPQPISDVRKNYRIHVGPFYMNPVILLKELGVDTNVFNAAGAQKSDFTFTVTPQAELAVPFARRALVKVTLGSDVVYYAQYVSERSVDPQAVVRAEAYAHRLTLFVQESYLNTRQRPNFEIDLRSRHLQNDLSGGVSLRLSPTVSVEIARSHNETRFNGDAFFLGQRLQDALNRNSDAYDVTVRRRLTALTTLGVRYENRQDRFQFSSVRNTDSFRVMPGIEFKPRALLNGSAWVGYRSFKPKNPDLPPQTGFVSQLALSYTLLGATTFGVTHDRDYQFAFEALTPYFAENAVGVYVRRAIGGRFDVLTNVARHRYTYQRLAIQPAQLAAIADRVDTTKNYGVNLGYRLNRQTRVGFGVSYYTRSSTIELFRDFDGLRIGTTVSYVFY